MVNVRRHVRRRPSQIALRRRPPSSPGSFGAAIDDVVAGRRSGYTWTGGYKFDVDDARTMDALYDHLRRRNVDTLYVLARTNRTLAEWEARVVNRDPSVTSIGRNFGLGIWRDDDGTIYVDDISVLVFKGERDDDALRFARLHNQKSILKVDASKRSFVFLQAVPRLWD